MNKRMGPRRKRMGRPPLPAGQAMYTQILIRVKPAFRTALERAARRQHKTLTAFIRDCLFDALKKERT
jgi:predicted HicB family RNase H-like nuclease